MKSNDIQWVDFTRVVAIFSVVLLHSAAPLLYRYNTISSFNWWVGNIYDSAVRPCVPLFFMITGYLLLGKQESVKDYLLKRSKRILIPFIVWSIIYVFWRGYLGETITPLTFLRLIFIPAYYHLWFFYAIIWLYLYIPILRVFMQYSKKGFLYYFIILWFIAVLPIPFIEKAIPYVSEMYVYITYTGYLVVGYLLGNTQTNKKHAIQSLLVSFICLLITITGTYFLTAQSNREYLAYGEYFHHYSSPNIILQSVSIFIFLKHFWENALISSHQKTILKVLSSASFGIYLIHPIVLDVLAAGWLGFSISAFSKSAIYSIPTTTTLAFGLSFIIIIFLQKIPLIRVCVS